ncbi:histidine kinase [Polaribacter sp. SA4-10]|uniref:sensor histidine kinase n=1 Tax=Polaribacter sp. SA4-10 TaxID=754397 RepID=UPI000B3BFCBC|nr:GAF domain-containing sensor histidine kinase [Polaribacter sp. SA4-10]ARV05522.1 histidine kinase [Polaribacter sp. SA4-10]
MIEGPIPDNENERIEALKRYQVLDTISEKEYDDITRIASEICETPIALVSLVDTKRQWFKSHHGLDATETPRNVAFCAHAINTPDELFIIPDTSKDERFKDNPLSTGNPNVIFYAGAPLNTKEGFSLGTLCVIDNKPRTLTDGQKESLKSLSSLVISQFETRLRNRQLSEANNENLRLNKQLSEFAYRLTHDIKSAISGIKFLSEIIVEDYSDKLDNEGKTSLNLISSNSTYLYSLVEGILNFTTATNKEIVYENFNLKVVLENIKHLNNWENKYVINYIDCDISIKQSKIGFIQIFQNLLSNSIKFVEVGESIISISLEIESDFYKISYKNNSPVIEDKYHKKVFELFETLDKKKGVGIGLSTIGSIIERLGGSIKIVNLKDENLGVEFCIKVPIIKD